MNRTQAKAYINNLSTEIMSIGFGLILFALHIFVDYDVTTERNLVIILILLVGLWLLSVHWRIDKGSSELTWPSDPETDSEGNPLI